MDCSYSPRSQTRQAHPGDCSAETRCHQSQCRQRHSLACYKGSGRNQSPVLGSLEKRIHSIDMNSGTNLTRGYPPEHQRLRPPHSTTSPRPKIPKLKSSASGSSSTTITRDALESKRISTIRETPRGARCFYNFSCLSVDFRANFLPSGPWIWAFAIS